MVPAIRNILGGFLFSGDDIHKKAGVLSGGERTRLAVARMLLRPSNTLLLDEPTNHLDLDSKDVLLEALEDYGGTLILVSHDRYFVEKLATKIIEIGHGEAVVYPGTYSEFLWSKRAREEQGAGATAPAAAGPAESGSIRTAPARKAKPRAPRPRPPEGSGSGLKAPEAAPAPGSRLPERRQKKLQPPPRSRTVKTGSGWRRSGRRSSGSRNRCASASPTSRRASRRAKRK